MKAIKNRAGGYDLRIERDSGNEVLILTGRYANSLDRWKQLQALAEEVIHNLENVNEEYQEEQILPPVIL